MKKRYLESAWYFGGWSELLPTGKVNGVVLAERNIAVYRTETGRVAAIGDRCPHRFAPLHRGQVKGERLECGYHGLQFGTDGQCAFNPHGKGATPTAARVPSYSTVERDGAIWIWLATEKEPDPSLIPDFSLLTACPETARVHIPTMNVDADYELIVDNLFDPTHAEYVHAGTFGGTGELSNFRPRIEADHAKVVADWSYDGVVAVPYLQACLPDQPVDTWIRATWYAPGVVVFEAGIKAAGRSRQEGFLTVAYHIPMPTTPGKCTYDVKAIRSFAVEDVGMTATTREMAQYAFNAQDKPMIQAQHAMMNGTDFSELNPVLFATDAAPVRVRRALQSLIEENEAVPA